MTILSAQTIRKRCLAIPGMIFPFLEKTIKNGMSFGISPAGYDIRVLQDVVLVDHGFELVSSVEFFCMPTDVLGRVADKSTWARKGLAVQNTVIEPGWRGYLTLELSNNTCQPITIREGSPIAQVIFELLDAPTDTPYEGKYQDQPGGVVFARLEADE